MSYIMNKIYALESQIDEMSTKMNKKYDNIQDIIQELTKQINDISNVKCMELIKTEKNGSSSLSREIARREESASNEEMSDQSFIDGLILNEILKKNWKLKYSSEIPFDSYFEYQIEGCGDFVYIFVYSNMNAQMLIEFVKNTQIAKQKIININGEGCIRIEYDKFIGKENIRFRSLNKKAYIKILQVNKRKIFHKLSLAYYIS